MIISAMDILPPQTISFDLAESFSTQYPLLYARKRLTLRNDVSIKAVDL